MADNSKIVPRESSSNGRLEVFSSTSRFPVIDLSPRERHLYDYLLILRKQQWLILTFLVTVVTIVSVATFRMKPVYVASAEIAIDHESTGFPALSGHGSL